MSEGSKDFIDEFGCAIWIVVACVLFATCHYLNS